jgi:hypothetical protein
MLGILTPANAYLGRAREIRLLIPWRFETSDWGAVGMGVVPGAPKARKAVGRREASLRCTQRCGYRACSGRHWSEEAKSAILAAAAAQRVPEAHVRAGARRVHVAT